MIVGSGNGPIDSFFQALSSIGITGYEFVNYHEHAISAAVMRSAFAILNSKFLAMDISLA